MENKLPAPTFALPPPKLSFADKCTNNLPHFLSPNGIQQLPRTHQPPPMYGPKGSTIPPKFLPEYGKGSPQKQSKEYCEPCDWEFQSLAALRRHESEHETCAVEGCNFKAIAKVVDKHIEIAHQTGIFEQIKKLDSPEEIAKWREARKKRYPTVQNVQLRQQIRQEKFERGEKLEPRNSRFGRTGDRIPKEKQFNKRRFPSTEKKSFNEKGEKCKKVAPKVNKTAKEMKHSQIIEEKKDESLWNGHLPMFKGTSKWKNYKHISEKNALHGLLADYGSDTSEDEFIDLQKSDEVTSVKINDIEEIRDLKDKTEDESKGESNFVEDQKIGRKSNLVEEDKCDLVDESNVKLHKLQRHDSDDTPVECPIRYEPEPESISTILHTKTVHKKGKKRESGLNANMSNLLRKTRKQNTLLEKLLEPQIIHERNVILQCVKYVVAQNFFQENKS